MWSSSTDGWCVSDWSTCLEYSTCSCRTPSSGGLANGSATSNGSNLSAEMEQVKQEILGELRVEMNKLKQDILEGLL